MKIGINYMKIIWKLYENYMKIDINYMKIGMNYIGLLSMNDN